MKSINWLLTSQVKGCGRGKLWRVSKVRWKLWQVSMSFHAFLLPCFLHPCFLPCCLLAYMLPCLHAYMLRMILWLSHYLIIVQCIIWTGVFTLKLIFNKCSCTNYKIILHAFMLPCFHERQVIHVRISIRSNFKKCYWIKDMATCTDDIASKYKFSLIKFQWYSICISSNFSIINFEALEPVIL